MKRGLFLCDRVCRKEMIIFESLLATFEKSNNFEASVEVVEIGLSLNPMTKLTLSQSLIRNV